MVGKKLILLKNIRHCLLNDIFFFIFLSHAALQTQACTGKVLRVLFYFCIIETFFPRDVLKMVGRTEGK